ncbi:pseudouridine synthase [Helicobacter saguini]|uniref:Pseudouridine synthase n=1 Tax=Helicobacter saguini TaxID=1548018 RepID=A0A347W0D7_9HELI|nr:pseudouridine synthase [Helicobacter saguini]MWV66711.1 pseudouridine synthase [Helicobacter saguini]MWV69061.1 pseudouridine synthase [Helicobacter saguini]MWV71385.1 pseudouridine synthase [Helicobacter saguini]TLD94047.1 rRNA pseudouridine synthase [Helicobacter saguini]
MPFEILYYFCGKKDFGLKDFGARDSKIDSKDSNISNKNNIKVIESKSQAIKNFRIFINNTELKYYKETPYTAIVYHKPKGELVSKKDSKNRRLIFDSLDSKFAHFMPVGRLDYASEGLLVLSDSKEVVSKLMESSLPRTYIVKIDCKITSKMLDGLENGVSLKDSRGGHSRTKISQMEIPKMEYKIIKNGNFSKLKLTLNEGKNREIRRFFAHFNANVLDLKRVSYGFINLNALPCGKSRYFNKEEYKDLKEFLKLDSIESKKGKI